MKPITYSAPAKVILSGEHAVVYGKPALICAIDLRLHFSVSVAKKKPKNKIIAKIDSIITSYLTKQKSPFLDQGFDYSIESEIPIGAGLGSSAALSVASVAALLEFYTKKSSDSETINNLAYKVEKYFHQNPSGIDNTAATFGGLIFFRKEFEFLKTISLLNFKIPKKIADNLYLVDSGKPYETTKDMVNLVGSLYTYKPKETEEQLLQIEKQTKRMVISIARNDTAFLREAIIANQISLQKLGVVSKSAENILKTIEPFAVGKVTGAGGQKKGSGYLLLLASDKAKLEVFMRQKKISFYKFTPSLQGVRKEIE